jgi:hypothetical protein
MPLTLADKRKISKIKALSELAHVAFWQIEKEPDADTRAVMFDYCADRIVRAGVTGEYVLIDELLTDLICRHFFGEESFVKLWRKKNFRTFNFHIMEDTSLLKKLTIVKSIIEVPKPIPDIIQRINSLRNALAHSFFPQNRREHKKRGVVAYKSRNIVTATGYKRFSDDARQATDFLFKKLKGRF